MGWLYSGKFTKSKKIGFVAFIVFMFFSAISIKYFIAFKIAEAISLAISAASIALGYSFIIGETELEEIEIEKERLEEQRLEEEYARQEDLERLFLIDQIIKIDKEYNGISYSYIDVHNKKLYKHDSLEELYSKLKIAKDKREKRHVDYEIVKRKKDEENKKRFKKLLEMEKKSKQALLEEFISNNKGDDEKINKYKKEQAEKIIGLSKIAEKINRKTADDLTNQTYMEVIEAKISLRQKNKREDPNYYKQER